MFCSKCGKEVEENWKFCNYCGNKLLHQDKEKSNVERIIQEIRETEKTNKNNENKEVHKISYAENSKLKNIIIIILVAIIIIGIVMYFIHNKFNDNTLLETATVQEEQNIEPLTKEEKYAVDAIKLLKQSLKNPESLQVYSVFLREDEPYTFGREYDSKYHFLFKVDYSAQNGFGGMTRNDYYFSYSTEGVLTDIDSLTKYETLNTLFNNNKYRQTITIDVERIMDNI